MIIGDFLKAEMKIAKQLEKKLKKLKYTDISIKKDTFSKGYFTVAGIEPLGKRVISVNLTINEMKTRI